MVTVLCSIHMIGSSVGSENLYWEGIESNEATDTLYSVIPSYTMIILIGVNVRGYFID
jgi:hypothetical protein